MLSFSASGDRLLDRTTYVTESTKVPDCTPKNTIGEMDIVTDISEDTADEPGYTVHQYQKYQTKIIDSDDTKLQAMETKQNAILEQGTAHNCSIVTADSSKTTMTKEVIPDIAISNTTTKYETVTACEAINMDTGKGSDKVTDIRTTKFISKVSF